MPNNLHRQYLIRNKDTYLVAWLKDGLEEGWHITLRDSEDAFRWWTIEEIWNVAMPKSEIRDSHDSKNWHKNDFRRRLKGSLI